MSLKNTSIAITIPLACSYYQLDEKKKNRTMI